MSKSPASLRHRILPWFPAIALAMLVLSLMMLFVHIQRFRMLQSTYLEIAQDLPSLRTHIHLQESHVEVQRLIGAETRTRLEEQAAIMVLPESVDSARAVRTLTDLVAIVGKQSGASVTSVTADAKSGPDRVVTLRMRGSFTDIARILAVLRWDGFLTVGDVIGDHVEELMTTLQDQSPLALPATEEFLRTDLLTYAAEPDIAEQKFLANVPEGLSGDLRAFVLDSGLSDVRLSLTPVAKSLRERRLWPLPLVSLSSLVFEQDQIVAAFTFHTREVVKTEK